MKQPAAERSAELNFSISIGGAFFPLCDTNPTLYSFKDIVNMSDAAMYRSKENGRNQAHIFYPGPNPKPYAAIKSLFKLPKEQIPADVLEIKKVVIS